ncbi:hypothetical protein [Actinomadura sp. BRA 177]|uniref:hypothetical protein n=1 Tax=Actinomadura sp. BRA 177 TaxID=2745202 RepID=UPI0015959BC1|nr:hypothetical protein [Actinomadura sp. BRA 177]
MDLVLDVLVVNHRARALYERLGPHEAARHGDGKRQDQDALPPPNAAAQIFRNEVAAPSGHAQFAGLPGESRQAGAYAGEPGDVELGDRSDPS